MASGKQAQSSAERRPVMAINDILNPINNGDSGGPQGSATTTAGVASQSSSSRQASRERRQFRPTYSDEEVYFIWYHRIDLGYDWQDITNAYNAQFPDRRREGFGGIQCKYYRYCEEFGLPKVRNRDRGASQVQEYGMRARTGLSYPWMRS